MRRNTFLSVLLVAGLASASLTAQAQTTPMCPAMPPQATGLEWSMLITDSAVLCRAIDRTTRVEAFAVTMARKSPFRPDSAMRAEEGKIEGEKIWWYRTEIAGRPNELVRETLVKVGRDQVAHVFIRTENKDTLSQYQGIVQSLQFSGSGLAAR